MSLLTGSAQTCATVLTTCADVKVPIENTLGKENDGLKVILSKCVALRLARLTCSFNHERLVMATGSCRAAREIVEQCFKCVTWPPASFDGAGGRASARSSASRSSPSPSSASTWPRCSSSSRPSRAGSRTCASKLSDAIDALQRLPDVQHAVLRRAVGQARRSDLAVEELLHAQRRQDRRQGRPGACDLALLCDADAVQVRPL